MRVQVYVGVPPRAGTGHGIAEQRRPRRAAEGSCRPFIASCLGTSGTCWGQCHFSDLASACWYKTEIRLQVKANAMTAEHRRLLGIPVRPKLTRFSAGWLFVFFCHAPFSTVLKTMMCTRDHVYRCPGLWNKQ